MCGSGKRRSRPKKSSKNHRQQEMRFDSDEGTISANRVHKRRVQSYRDEKGIPYVYSQNRNWIWSYLHKCWCTGATIQIETNRPGSASASPSRWFNNYDDVVEKLWIKKIEKKNCRIKKSVYICNDKTIRTKHPIIQISIWLWNEYVLSINISKLIKTEKVWEKIE